MAGCARRLVRGSVGPDNFSCLAPPYAVAAQPDLLPTAAGNSFTTKAGVEMLTCYEGSRTYGCHSDPLGEPFFWAMCIGTLLWHGGGFFILAIALRVLPALYAVTIYEVRCYPSVNHLLSDVPTQGPPPRRVH